MKEFTDLAHFAEHLLVLQYGELIALEKGLDNVLAHMEQVAKDEIGHYQPQVGPFPAWPELAESTKMDRLSKGFDPDEPLLRTGELRDSISHETQGLEGAMGSTSDIMVYQELGTATIPPRPVIGPAAFRSKEKLLKMIGEATVIGLLGGSAIPPGLGYEKL